MSRIEPSTRVADQVFEAIHEAIIRGDLPAGKRLNMRELSDELGTSTMPVREAIRRLEEMGLAEAVPYRGAIVRGFTDKELLDLYAVRRRLEVDAATLGTARSSATTIARMVEEFGAMERAVEAADPVDYLDRDEGFLAVLYEESDNAVLVEMIRTLWHRCRSYKLLGAQRTMAAGDGAPLLDHQRALLAAVRAGDAERAGVITGESIDSATTRIGEAIRPASDDTD